MTSSTSRSACSARVSGCPLPPRAEQCESANRSVTYTALPAVRAPFDTVCRNSDELFKLNVGQPFVCDFLPDGFAALKRWLLEGPHESVRMKLLREEKEAEWARERAEQAAREKAEAEDEAQAKADEEVQQRAEAEERA